MSVSTNKIALVTDASRGVGKGVALSLGEAGATVYITGRKRANSGLPGSLAQTADEVTALGGHGIPLYCDHTDDQQVRAAFEQVAAEQGRLDLLVNSAWAGYEGYATGRYRSPHTPFYEKPLDFWDDNLVGLRWAYVAGGLAANGSRGGVGCGSVGLDHDQRRRQDRQPELVPGGAGASAHPATQAGAVAAREQASPAQTAHGPARR